MKGIFHEIPSGLRHLVLIIPIAILNGAFRENVLVKPGSIASPISAIMLSTCIFVVAHFLISKIKKCKRADYILFGVL